MDTQITIREEDMDVAAYDFSALGQVIADDAKRFRKWHRKTASEILEWGNYFIDLRNSKFPGRGDGFKDCIEKGFGIPYRTVQYWMQTANDMLQVTNQDDIILIEVPKLPVPLTPQQQHLQDNHTPEFLKLAGIATDVPVDPMDDDRVVSALQKARLETANVRQELELVTKEKQEAYDKALKLSDDAKKEIASRDAQLDAMRTNAYELQQKLNNGSVSPATQRKLEQLEARIQAKEQELERVKQAESESVKQQKLHLEELERDLQHQQRFLHIRVEWQKWAAQFRVTLNNLAATIPAKSEIDMFDDYAWQTHDQLIESYENIGHLLQQVRRHKQLGETYIDAEVVEG